MEGITKSCRKCKKTVNVKFFNPDRLGKHGVASTCKECVNGKKLEKAKNTPQKKYKAPNKISKKRHAMTSQHFEANMFLKIAKSRPPICENCNNPIRPVDYETPNNYPAYCFAHICPKWTFPELRLFKNNIAFVCSLGCHEEIDLRTSGIRPVLRKYILKWKRINFKALEKYTYENL